MLPLRIQVFPHDAFYCVRAAVSLQEIARTDDAAAAIERALAEAGGGEVQLEPGEYLLNRPVRLTARASLRGCGRGTRLRITAANEAGVAVHGREVDGAVVRDLSVAGEVGATRGTGVLLEACGDCHLAGLFLVEPGAIGVRLRENCFLCEVRDSQFAGCSEAAVVLEDLAKGRIGDYLPNTLRNLQVVGGGFGLKARFAVVVNVLGCTFFQTGRHAIVLEASSNSVLIQGCRTFQITGSPVFADEAHELNITGNIFCWHTDHGIVVRRSSWGCLSGNEVIDTGSFNPGTPDQATRFDALPAPPEPKTAICLEAVKGFNITGNTLFNWPQGTRMEVGVREDEACADNTITGNNVNYYRADRPILSTSARALIDHNHGAAAEPHLSRSDYPLIQSFEPHRTRAFIESMR